jgi:hypothetical protein
MARKRIEFWLDENKPNEQWLLDNIPMLKSKWVFSRCMREGLELLIHFRAWSIKAADVYELLLDLREGNLDKLLSMFPHLRAKLGSSGAEENELTKEVRRLQDLMLSISKGDTYATKSLVSAPTSVAGPKKITAPNFAMPVFEDDQPTLVFNKVTETENGSSLNFINMSKQLVKK